MNLLTVPDLVLSEFHPAVSTWFHNTFPSVTAAQAQAWLLIEATTLEHIAITLLRRYGVVFWRLLEREAQWPPSWRLLLRTFHRLEARGEIRGGRFVSGLAGEQFALPEAIPVLREIRKRPLDGSLISVCAVDPLNLAGTLLPGDKIPALVGNRLVYRDGVAVAAMVAGKPVFWPELDAQDMVRVRNRLVR